MSVDKVQDPEVRTVLQNLLNGQEKMQGCLDGLAQKQKSFEEKQNKHGVYLETIIDQLKNIN